jgi:hypothetical protein
MNITITRLLRSALPLALLTLTACGGGGGGGGGTGASDTTAPITTAVPAVSGTTDTATTLSVTVNENGTGYYLVVLASAVAPTATQVLQAGTAFTMTAYVPATPAISGLIFNTHYTIYFVAKDAANNVQAAVQSVPVTTLLTAGYVVQGGLTWMPVTFSDTWPNADAYCTNTTINGVTGWRMPTENELYVSFYFAYQGNSSVLTGKGWTLSYTWSSTGGAGYHSATHLIDGGYYDNPDTSNFYVSCVR